VPLASKISRSDCASNEGYAFFYSVCTFVTNHNLYQQMLASFDEAGFDSLSAEFIYIDNSNGSEFDAYEGIREFLNRARGKYVIVCHQDIVVIDKKDALDDCLANLNSVDPYWAVVGNAGGESIGKISVRISDGSYGDNIKRGNLPARVESLDENFLVIKSGTRVGTSRFFSGFHLYGTDLCLNAKFLGYTSYVINFHLRHLGGEGMASTMIKTITQSEGGFEFIRKSFIRAYQERLQPLWVQTTCARLYLSGSPIKNRLFNRKIVFSIYKRISKFRSFLKGTL